MKEPFYCTHKENADGYWKKAWRSMRSRELAKKNAWAYLCYLCGAVMIKQIFPVESELGMRFEVKTYYPKNTKLTLEEPEK